MMLSQTFTLLILFIFWVAMIMICLLRRSDAGLDQFLVANRSVGMGIGAMSVASTWIWAPALFIAAQKAFQQGIPGLFWFTVPNVGSLIFFAFIAKHVLKFFPNGYTLPQHIAQTYDGRTHLVYIFCFLGLQICSLAVQLIAGASLLHYLCGVKYWVGVVLLILLFSSYSIVDGLKTSIRTDLFQMAIILVGGLILVPMAIIKGGGWESIRSGFGGFSGNYTHFWDLHVAYTFGITVTIGLMSGPMGDQQHWQRAFAFKPNTLVPGYVLGAIIFAIVPVMMGILGFLAAGIPEIASSILNGNVPPQHAGTQVISYLLPSWCLLMFFLMIIAGLASTGDSALCAGGAIVAIDIYKKYMRPKAPDHKIFLVARLAIIGMAVGAVLIALIPKITILTLFLFYGTLRSAVFCPTIIMGLGKNVQAWGMFWGISLAILLGLPCYIYGEITDNVHYKIMANLGILFVSSLLPLLTIKKKCKRELV